MIVGQYGFGFEVVQPSWLLIADPALANYQSRLWLLRLVQAVSADLIWID